jgi:hypothetical protein
VSVCVLHNFAKSSNWMGPQYYWRQHQGCPEFSLEVTNALVAMVSNSSGMEDRCWKMLSQGAGVLTISIRSPEYPGLI